MKQSLWWKLALAWAVLIFLLSSIPGRSFPDVGVLRFDKVLHALVYAVLAGICFFALRGSLSPTLALLAAAALAVAYGISDEFHQMFVPGRSSDIFDVVADGVGGLLGGGVASLWDKVRRSS